MVRRYEAARADPYLAAQLHLRYARSLRDPGIDYPTVDDEAWALLESEFKLRVIHTLSGKK